MKRLFLPLMLIIILAPNTGQACSGKNLLGYFTSTCPDKNVITHAVADLNNDGSEDMVIIYRVSREKNMMCVVLNLPDGTAKTNELPAPAENLHIQIRNIDAKPPMEFIVQGMKGAKFGYAVYRVEGTTLVDLFGQGMEDCC